MTEPSIEQIRIFRLRSHHLDSVYSKSETDRLAGACGMQNTPPGAWETALFNRVPDCTLSDMEHLLYEQKTLLQAWSYRGTPVVFPVSESSTFLSALIPDEPEPWIYTQGIALALDFLQMDFDSLLEILKQVIPQLDDHVIVSKSALDQTLAGWMTPLIPIQKRELWNQPSMYGSPDVQTVGGAVVSFLLRPCAFHGLVVFGKRDGISPTFTSFKNWTGSPIPPDRDAEKKLVRKYLHCYGPATADMFAGWLGCSGKQARRMWNTIQKKWSLSQSSKKRHLSCQRTGNASLLRPLLPGITRKICRGTSSCSEGTILTWTSVTARSFNPIKHFRNRSGSL